VVILFVIVMFFRGRIKDFERRENIL